MAGRYRRVDVGIWGDEKFRRLSPLAPSGQALWLYLLTAVESTSVPGVVSVFAAALAARLGWSEEDFWRCWSEVEESGMAVADWEAPLVWLPNAVRYNRPANPNVVTSWGKLWREVPECELREEARAALASFLATVDAGSGTQVFSAAFAAACPAPFGNGSGKASPKTRKSRKDAGRRSRAAARLVEESAESPAPRKGGREEPVDTDESSGAAGTWGAPFGKQEQEQNRSPLDPPTPEAQPLPGTEPAPTPFVAWALEVYPDVRDPARLERAAAAAFPGVDLLAEARKAFAWEAADPRRRKTLHGRFLNTWWANAAKDAAARPSSPPQEPRPHLPAPGCNEWERLRASLRERLRPDLFDRFFAPLTGSMSDDGALVLHAPDPYAARFLDDNYRAWLSDVGALPVKVACP